MTPDSSAAADRADRVLALVEDNVRTELQVVNGMLELELRDEAVEALMQGVVAGLLYAFSLDWSPDWVKHGEVHHWSEGDRHFARCGVCLEDSPPAPDETSASAWAHEHERSH